jgi:hypothetical protein
MHPKYVLPLFPAPNSARVSFEIFGELFAGDDEGFGVDAAAQTFMVVVESVQSVLNLGSTPPLHLPPKSPNSGGL